MDATQYQSKDSTLLVQAPGSKLLTVDVTGGTLVGDLKKDLEGRTGLLAKEFYLIHGTKALQDSNALEMYGLMTRSYDHHAIVQLCVRQKGGCFIITASIVTILFFATIFAPCTCGLSLLLYILLPAVFVLPFFCL